MDIPALLSFLAQYQVPALFLGAFFFGETVILAAVFLAAQGLWPLSDVFWISLFGTITADIAWFLIGRHILRSTKRWERLKRKHAEHFGKLEKGSEQKQLLYLVFFKFLYGTRIITILYVSAQGMTAWKFLLFDTAGTAVWLAAVIAVGTAAWSGLSRAIPAFHAAEYALGAALILALLIKITGAYLKTLFRREHP